MIVFKMYSFICGKICGAEDNSPIGKLKEATLFEKNIRNFFFKKGDKVMVNQQIKISMITIEP